MGDKRTKWKKKVGKKGLSLRKNKFFFGFFALLFAFIMLVSSTLAWSSYTEWARNHLQSSGEAKELEVKVEEKFEQDSVIPLTKGLEKSVKVRNTSSRSAIVRVKFYESIAPFEVDYTVGEGKGNGNLKTVKLEAGNKTIDRENVASWNAGYLYDSGKQDGAGKLYYTASSETVNNQLYKGEANRLSSGVAALKILKWQLNSAVKTAPDASATPYWVFDSSTGYFYYSKVLERDTDTAIDLLQKVLFQDNSIPNKYRYALYDIKVVAEGMTANEAGVKTWTKDAALLDMYRKDPLFNTN